jgi:hypothetical protein
MESAITQVGLKSFKNRRLLQKPIVRLKALDHLSCWLLIVVSHGRSFRSNETQDPSAGDPLRLPDHLIGPGRLSAVSSFVKGKPEEDPGPPARILWEEIF